MRRQKQKKTMDAQTVPKRRKKGWIIVIVLIILAIIMIGGLGFYLYKMNQLKKVASMSAQDMLQIMTKDKKDVKITVGVIKNGEAHYTVYGENGSELPHQEYLYEIGSLTKTVTGALVCKAVESGKMKLEDSIDQYLDLPKQEHYPTIEQLVTHTSGYKSYYMETEMISNHLHGKNDFYGISKDKLLKRIGKVHLKDKEYGFSYSNFGMAVVGLVLEKVYGQNYTDLMNTYLHSELKLMDTRVSGGSMDGTNFWDWKAQDAYIPAGALISDISDMMEYAQMEMDAVPMYLSLGQQKQETIQAQNPIYDKMGICMDSIGVNWLYDEKAQLWWHNGGTGKYNSYLGFDPVNKMAVVILSNLSPMERIPATVMGPAVMKELRESN